MLPPAAAWSRASNLSWNPVAASFEEGSQQANVLEGWHLFIRDERRGGACNQPNPATARRPFGVSGIRDRRESVLARWK